MRLPPFIKILLLLVTVRGSSTIYAQEVQTLELSTSEVHPIAARIGNASLIQLPIEAIATNVGDPAMWLVEKMERTVSIKPIQESARDTSLAVITRQGTLNFSVQLSSPDRDYTQTVRVTRILDDSRPLAPQEKPAETLAETMIREIRIAQNYHALKLVNSSQLKNVEQCTLMQESKAEYHTCILLQTFRFRESRHILLHFITENPGDKIVSFDVRRTTVNLGETLFAPVAVSLGMTTLIPKASSENFLVLDGSQGLSPRQEFKILLVEILQAERL